MASREGVLLSRASPFSRRPTRPRGDVPPPGLRCESAGDGAPAL